MTRSDDTARLAASTDRLGATVAGLSDAELRAPSLLPGWTRAHVLTHISRNSDGMRNLLLSARTGAAIGLYASREVRDADIEAGATRPAAVIRKDVIVAAERLGVEIAALPDDAWTAVVEVAPDVSGTPRFPATTIVAFRLFEVEVHHVDLDSGYWFGDIPAELLPGFIERAVGLLGDRGPSARLASTDTDQTWTLGAQEPGNLVSGPSADLLGWLLGRTDGAPLQAPDGSPVPDIPDLT